MEDMRGRIDPERRAAAVAALARVGRGGLLLDECIVRAYRDGGAPLDNDLVVNAVLVTVRLVQERIDGAAQGAGKDPCVTLVRSVAAYLAGNACDTIAAQALRAKSGSCAPGWVPRGT